MKDFQTDASRREFLKRVSMASALMMGGNPTAVSQDAPTTARQPAPPAKSIPDNPFIAIQIGARSFVDEGVEQCLDTLKEKANVNVLMPTVFTYGRGLAGRQIPGLPLPDHGVQAYDEIHGGSYAKVHPEFYKGSVIQDIRAPELGDFDILADVTPKARARGMKVYCLFEEAYNPALMPNFEKIAEVDVNGKIGRSTCFNNPGTRATFSSSMVQDWFTNNDLDGMMWESERQGPLNTALHAGLRHRRLPSHLLFLHVLPHQRPRTRESTSTARARATSRSTAGRAIRKADARKQDGSFITLWRLLLEYPEILAWQNFWTQSQQESLTASSTAP